MPTNANFLVLSLVPNTSTGVNAGADVNVNMTKPANNGIPNPIRLPFGIKIIINKPIVTPIKDIIIALKVPNLSNSFPPPIFPIKQVIPYTEPAKPICVSVSPLIVKTGIDCVANATLAKHISNDAIQNIIKCLFLEVHHLTNLQILFFESYFYY